MKRKRRKRAVAPLDARHYLAVALIASGEYSYGEIASRVGVDRRTLLRWRKRKDFDKELRKARAKIAEEVRKSFGDRKRLKTREDIFEYFGAMGIA